MFALGPVGLMAVAGAKLRGAGHIIGVESVPNRQKLGELYGVDEIVDFTREDAVDRVLELTELRMQRLLRVLEHQHLDPPT